eukprot:403332778
MMSETQQLKFLQSDKYIAQVKEEIIEYDPSKNLINDYLVVVERARFSLNDLLKIWNDEDLRSRYYEFYSPEKLAYYFYQAMQIMAYLHQRDVYYGDMKPHNLLVFKDQLVKVGDLGITMKLDKSIPDDQKAYFLKGLTLAYASQKVIKDLQRNIPQSRQELFEADIYSLITTFQQCIENTMKLNTQSENKNICQDILNDLMSNQDLRLTLKTWSKNIMQNASFVQNLITQMKDENKIEAIYHIAYLTKYKLIFEGQLLPIIQDCAIEKNKQKLQIQILSLDNLQDYHNEDDFIKFETILTIKQNIMGDLKIVQQANGLPLNESKTLFQTFEPYFTLQGKIKLEESRYYLSKELENIIKGNEDHFYQNILFQIITNQKDEIYNIKDKLDHLDKKFPNRKKFILPLKFEKIRIQGGEESDESQISEDENTEQQIASFQNSILPQCNESFLDNCKSIKKTVKPFQELFNVDIINLKTKKDFYANNQVNLVFLYIDVLKGNNFIEEALKESQIWLQKYRDLCGDSHMITLKFFGLVGELLIKKDIEKEETNQQGLNYLIKFSKLNVNTYIHFLLLLEELNLHHIIPEHLPPFYHLLTFDKDVYKNLIVSVFTGIQEEATIIQTLEFIGNEIQKIEEDKEKNEYSENQIETMKFLFAFMSDTDQFKIFMRYLESIQITPDTIEYKHQTSYEIKEGYDITNTVCKGQIVSEKLREIFESFREYKQNQQQKKENE